MKSNEILTLVNDVLRRRSPLVSAKLAYENNRNAIIETTDGIYLSDLKEISDATGDKYILIDSHPDGGQGVDLYIDCN